jgi:acyl-coenzyme A thioesterase PaaI-like protein
VHIAYVRPVPVGHRVSYTTDVVHTGRTLGVAHVIGRNEAGKACTVATVITH